MKKINKTIKIHIGILLLIYIILILCITKFQYIYGSNVDFIRQHIVFPDYFRNLFYNTGKLIPNFALHLGGGENIFYFAYYGFLSPIILLSYFLPFIDMTTYLIISNLILIFISVLLVYYFLYKNKYNPSICFITSLLFLFSNSLLFHSHRHFMFVNYIPFLLTSLIGVNRYFDKQKSFLLILSIFLMILTSFYFSIPGILTVCLYGLYYYIKLNNKVKLKNIFITALKFLIRIFLSILLSSFFLLPVAYIILNGRNTTTLNFNLSLFIPKVNLEFLMYGTYGVGLTSIMLVSLVYNLINKKKENFILSILLTILSIFPIINCILNGGLYQNGKCFIPFLPLYILLIAEMIYTLPKNKLKWTILLIGIIISLFFINAKLTYLLFLTIEIIITILCLFFFHKKGKYIYFTPILILAFIICITTNNTDNLIEIKNYKEIEKINNYNYENLIDDHAIYRFINQKNKSNAINYSKALNDYRPSSYSSTTNPYYTKEFYNTFNNNNIYRNKFMLEETNNLFFQRFMGVKYLLTDKNIPYGYKLIKQYDNANFYETENVYPIGFASSNILNEQEYEKLLFNEKLEAFGNNIIINGKSQNANLITLSKQINLDYKIKEQKNIEYEIKNNHYLINSKKNGKLILALNSPIIDNSLIIRFKNNKIPNCKNGDIAITVNEITNKLTCATWKYYNENEIFDYVLSNNEKIDSLEIKFEKGFYDISNLEIYQIPNSYFTINEETISKLNIVDTYNNSILNGNINVKEDGYFLFTIPYDKGFEILIDNQSINYELVNKAFIGFPIKKGTHSITLKFHAPLFKEGKIISGISIILIGMLLILEKKKNCNN